MEASLSRPGHGVSRSANPLAGGSWARSLVAQDPGRERRRRIELAGPAIGLLGVVDAAQPLGEARAAQPRQRIRRATLGKALRGLVRLGPALGVSERSH